MQGSTVYSGPTVSNAKDAILAEGRYCGKALVVDCGELKTQ